MYAIEDIIDKFETMANGMFINENAVYAFILNLTPERARTIVIKNRSA